MDRERLLSNLTDLEGGKTWAEIGRKEGRSGQTIKMRMHLAWCRGELPAESLDTLRPGHRRRSMIERRESGDPQWVEFGRSIPTLPLHCLLNADIGDLDALTARTEADLLNIPRLGRKGVAAIRWALMKSGRTLAGPPSAPEGNASLVAHIERLLARHGEAEVRTALTMALERRARG